MITGWEELIKKHNQQNLYYFLEQMKSIKSKISKINSYKISLQKTCILKIKQ